MAELRVALATSAVLLAVAGCSPSDPSHQNPREGSTTVSAPPLRNDAAPITKRFPSLGTPAELHWLGGAAGQDTGGVPGPTDVHIQVLAVLTSDIVEEATTDYRFKPATTDVNATIPTELRPYAPKDADWQTNDTFTTKVSTSGYNGTAYLDKATRTIYLDVIGS